MLCCIGSFRCKNGISPYISFLQYYNKNHLAGRSIHHGFGFDRILTYRSPNSIPSGELDDASRTSIKTLPFPADVKDRLFQLIKVSGKKKDIENYGSYVAERIAARKCVEVPRILPSVLLDDDYENKSYVDNLKRLYGDPKFAHLNTLFQQNKLGQNAQVQIELAEAEDARHKNSAIQFSPLASVAYTAHTFLGQYAVFLRIFYEIKRRKTNFKLSRILFYNAGAGPSIVAANTIWNMNQFSDVLVVENSQNLLKICKYLSPDLKNMRFQGDIYENTELFDCIVMPYCMTNICGYQPRTLLVKNLWNRLALGGIMVIVEPGTPTGFRMIHSIRELFISQLKKGYFHFIAPCPHEGICPLALTGKDWCHFSQRIFKIPHYIYRKGSIERSIDDEKYSYLAVGKGPGPRHKYQNEVEAPTAAEKSYFWPRIVLPPLKLGRRVLIDVCAAPNDFKRLIVAKNTPEASGYRYARDALWGDLWRFVQREERPIARGYTPDNVREYLLKSSDRKGKVPKTNIDNKCNVYVTQSLEHTDHTPKGMTQDPTPTST